MLAEIITIGDELLIGQVIDTNSAWMGQQLALNGIRLNRKVAVSDTENAIVDALKDCGSRAQIVLITGGLGPTKDDITKKTMAAFFGMKMRMDADVLNDVESLFKRFNKEMTPTNRLQAEVPDGCTVLRNKNGTAPGMWFEKDNVIYVSMPGVPYEMKAMFSDDVIPRLREKFSLPAIYHRTVMTQGIGESWLSDTLEEWESSLKAENIGLAYLPAPGIVRLRLTAYGNDQDELKNKINRKIEELPALIGKYIFATDDIPLHEVVGNELLQAGKTLVTAESCTGGFLAHQITSVAGSSQWFLGSTVTYANETKTGLLDIPQDIIAKNGAVSEEVALRMAENVRRKLNADFAISTTGIAGPSGGTPDKPVGTVWIAVATKETVKAKLFHFGDNRERNIVRSAQAGMMMLLKVMKGEF
jgi:nicotinamide-nucleotide amidase